MNRIKILVSSKNLADALHLKKIELADEVYILNVGGYIGESTQSEIDYAIKIGKPVQFLENPKYLLNRGAGFN